MRKTCFIGLMVLAIIGVCMLPAAAEELTLEQRVSNLENVLGDWQFYGGVIVQLVNNNLDEDAGDTTSTTVDLMGDSYFGALINHDNIFVNAEIGLDEMGSGEWDVYLRKFYGSYNFGTFKVGIGQDYTPVANMFYSTQIYNRWGYVHWMLDLGQAANGRHPQIKFESGGFQIALVKNHAATDLGTGGTIEKKIPKIEARYHLQGDTYFGDIFAGYQTYSLENAVDEYDVDSYVAGVGGGINMGDAYVRAGVFTGQNIAQFGLFYTGNASAAIGADNEIKDNTTIGGLGVIGYHIRSDLEFQSGIGYTSHDLDDAQEEDDTLAYYAQLNYAFKPTIIITPEIGVVDFSDDNTGADEGKETYAGVQIWVMF